MAIRFVLGRAGTGKTYHCLQAIREELRRSPEGPPLLLLVPEQATFQMERELADTPDLSGFIRAHVISFARLVYRILEIAGGLARPRLGELGRRMLLRSLLLRNEGSLRVFAGYARRPGFLERLARILGEMRAFAHTPENVERAAARLGPQDALLADKLHDLALLYRLYQQATSERYLDPDAALDRAAAVLDASGRQGGPFSALAGARLWVDGFAGFTPQEYRLLAALLCHVEAAEIALCVDPRLCLDDPPYVRWVPELHALAIPDRGFILEEESLLFAPTLRTYRELRERIDQLGLPVIPALRLTEPYRFRRAPALLYLEREWARQKVEVGFGEAGSTPGVSPRQEAGLSRREGNEYSQQRSGVPYLELVAAANRRLEVEAAALEILRLCREEGYRFREINVLTWSLEPYQALIDNVFTDLGIPYFMDVRRPLAHHPLVELVRSAVETVTSGFAPEPLFRFLKTDLGPVDRDAIDRLEEYVLQHGLTGSEAWLSTTPWTHQRPYTLEIDDPPTDGERQRQRDVTDFDRLRRQAVQELGRLAGTLLRLNAGAGEQGRGATAGEYCRALFEFLTSLQVEEKLARWAEEARRRGEPATAREHEEIWPLLVQLLDELVEGLGQQPLTLVEFRQVLETGLAGLSLGLIPPSLDQVLVGSVERSRTPAVRATLVLGMAEGYFPAVPQEDMLFLDQERELLGKEGLLLADTARTRLLHQRYLTYIALTRPAQRLWVSYPQSDESGRALNPAWAFRRLGELFPEQRVRRITDFLQLKPGDLSRLAGALASRLRSDPELAKDSQVQRLLQIVQASPLGKRIIEGVSYTNSLPRLKPETVAALYGRRDHDGSGSLFRSSVSRLEEFAHCPFRHFATFGLKLREWKEPEFDSLLWGQFAHAVLERLLRSLKREIDAGRLKDWSELTADEALPYLKEAFQEVQRGLAREPAPSPRLRFQVRLLDEVLRKALPALLRQIGAGEFRPFGLEVPFGPGRSDASCSASCFQAIVLAGGGLLELRGRIDRVDVAVVDDQVYVRVVDYKTGSGAGWQLEDVVNGLALQLPIYLGQALRWVAGAITGATARPAGLFFFPVARLWRSADLAARLAAAPEKVAEEQLKLYKLSGLVVCDRPVPTLMDGSLGAGGRSSLVPLDLTRDGQPYRNSANAVAEADLVALLSYVEQKAAQYARAILSGDITISPWSKPKAVACTHCPYHALCWFDRRFPANKFRYLPRRGERELWQEIREAANP
ncbi:MAG: PD-(D/E)XK nuclease family protein [Limnochordales bacterium]|nr:PD-(D/E)XK nuclease family protein [Limnochordales bacterium]